MNYKDYIETIPDFPIEGILFRDITPLLANGEAYKSAIKEIAEFVKSVGGEAVYGPESRGLPKEYVTRDTAVTLPMKEGQRSLNLSNSVAITVYEVIRQNGI